MLDGILEHWIGEYINKFPLFESAEFKEGSTSPRMPSGI